MKKVDYEHFARFAMPHTLNVRDGALYFCVKRADLEENKYTSDLYVLRDGETRRLTASGDVNDYRLLPEGVAFPALRGKKDKERAEKGVPLSVWQLLPYDGGEAAEWLRLDYAVSDIRFLSRERFFFTAAYAHEYAAALEAADGDAEKAAAQLREDREVCRVVDELPFWSNGAGFVNKTRSRLYIYENGEARALTDPYTDVGSLCLSADGARLYYSAARYTDVAPLQDRLFELDTATLEARNISVAPEASHYGAVPLPDGGLAVLAGLAARYGLNENPRLFLRGDGGWRELVGDGQHCFSNTVGSDVKAGRASPQAPPRCKDGWLFLTDTQGGSTRIVRVNLQTGALINVTREGWNITDCALYGEGLAMIAMREGVGCELYALDALGHETQLTALNTALAAEYAYAEPLPLSLTNERGDEIAGWVIPPVGAQPGKKYPAILDVHGGPKTAYGPCYFHEMQLWASRGFAVLFCNPTGSDGGGDRFADIRGHYGEQDFRDIMAFTDEALRRFDFLDAARLGVTGGSYGGFMTNWIVGHTDRFKAAASQRSISNWLSFYNTSDIGWFFAGDQVGGDPWNDLEKLWAQSPLHYADRVRTPTLFIHADEDYRCPLPEGMQMFSALVAHGVPARLCIFKGENHELSRSGKPKSRVRRLREITEWMEKYLQPAPEG